MGLVLYPSLSVTLHFEFDVGGFKPDSNMAWGAAISSEYAFTSWLGVSAGWNFYQVEHDAAVRRQPYEALDCPTSTPLPWPRCSSSAG